MEGAVESGSFKVGIVYPHLLAVDIYVSPHGTVVCVLKQYALGAGDRVSTEYGHVITSDGNIGEIVLVYIRNFLVSADICVFLDAENIHILNGNAEDLAAECAHYEKMIEEAGGIDLFIGGIGPDGHIAFNEPGSSLTSRTRQKTLTTDTRVANSRFFGGNPDNVPATALTVGVGTVMSAKEVLILCNGHNKSRALQAAIEGPVTQMWTISVLQMHQHGIIVCDEAACEDIKHGTYKYFKDIEKDNI